MDKQSYKIGLMALANRRKVKVFDEQLIKSIANTLITLEMLTEEQFASKQTLFIEVLREVFAQQFGKRFASFGGKYHPPTATYGPRYDLGLQIDEGDEGIYPIQVELVGKPTIH